jgi:hypothetical protein
MCENKCDCGTIKNTWEKVLEYASSPVQGTMSRKLRKGVKLQVNGGSIIADAQIFIGGLFIRFTYKDAEAGMSNLYVDFNKIHSLRTISNETEDKQGPK